MEDLDLDTAQGLPTQRPPCNLCKTPLEGQYFMARDLPVCPTCLESHYSGKGFKSFLRALVFGFIGAVLGALLDFLVTRITGLQLGLIAIVMGWLVGLGVSIGARGRGGCLYQVMAFALTYFAISVSLVGQISSAMMNGEIDLNAPTASASPAPNAQATPGPALSASPQPAASASPQPAASASPQPAASASPEATPAADSTTKQPLTGIEIIAGLISLAVMAAALPVIIGMEAPLSLLIYGFALYQAAMMNRKLIVTGPFQVNSPPSPALPPDE